MIGSMSRIAVRAAVIISVAALSAAADEPYRKPPAEIMRVLSAPIPPDAIVSPDGTRMLLTERILYPPISELAQPMLRLAGVRINPKNNGPHSAVLRKSLSIQSLTGAQAIEVSLPAEAEITAP